MSRNVSLAVSVVVLMASFTGGCTSPTQETPYTRGCESSAPYVSISCQRLGGTPHNHTPTPRSTPWKN